jgi:hypothetical protein
VLHDGDVHNDYETKEAGQHAEATSLAARYHLSAVYAFRFFTELGGLLSYGNDILR